MFQEKEKRLTGKVAREAILMLEIPRLPSEVIEGYKQLTDLTGTVSDAMDEMGIGGVVPASVLKPTIPNARMVGLALTIRNAPQAQQTYKGAMERVSKMGEIEGHNLAQPGDVLVIQGLDEMSNMGGISATMGKRQGEVGAIVDGGVRDADHSRSIGYPIWCRSISPATGKWRLQTVQINGSVNIAGARVEPGDLVVADETGICFVPREHAAKVLARAQEIAAAEVKRLKNIADGMPIPDLAQRTIVYKQ